MRILFVCWGNTCRSVIAEYLGQKRYGNHHVFESAGIAPQPAAHASNAIRALKKNFKIDASGHTPRDVRSLELGPYDLVIALDKAVGKCVGSFCPPEKLRQWAVPDPYGDDLTEYDRACAVIARELHASFGT